MTILEAIQEKTSKNAIYFAKTYYNTYVFRVKGIYITFSFQNAAVFDKCLGKMIVRRFGRGETEGLKT